MSDDDGVVVRDLGEHGTLRFHDGEGVQRKYMLHPLDGPARRLTSVTTVLACLAKPALLRWSEARGAAGTLAAVRAGMLSPDTHDDDDAISVVRSLGLGADRAKRDAAARGLDVHDALEIWARSGDLPEPQNMTDAARPYLQGLARALMSLDPEPTVVEQITCHPGLGYAGRLDLRAVVDGRDTLIDLKTSKSGRGWPEAHVQLRAYEAAEHALGEPYAERLLVVGIGPDGSFTADECAAPPRSFEWVLRVHRLMGDVQRALRVTGRERKAA